MARGNEVQEVEIEEVEVLDGSMALMAVDKAAIDIQINTAKMYPRSVTKALREAETLACMDEETAASMTYLLPARGEGNKKITGPSVRLAEAMVYAWGNLRAETNIESIDEKYVTAVGTCFDLEKNIAVRSRVKRRITNKYGKRYGDDMIQVTCNAAMAIAYRNAVFSVIPRIYAKAIEAKAREASTGKGTVAEKRKRAMEWFTKAGATEAQVLGFLGVKGLDDVGEDQLFELRGLKTAIETGETSLAAALSNATDEPSPAVETLRQKREAGTNGGDLFPKEEA